MSAYNARQFHHIYPKGYLASNGKSFHEANVIANICFLSASENNQISDTAPVDYFKKIPADDAAEIFDSAVIPANARNGAMPFDDFIRLRAESLKAIADQLMKTGRT